jgi:hypothetical protein
MTQPPEPPRSEGDGPEPQPPQGETPPPEQGWTPPGPPPEQGGWPPPPGQGGWPPPPGQGGWSPPPGQGGWAQPPDQTGWTPPGPAGPPPEQGGWPPPPGQGGWTPPPAQGGWPQQQPQWEHLGPPMPPPAKRRNRVTLVAVTIAIVALIAGGTATYLAVSDTHSGYQGAASPQEAVSSLVDDLNKSDVLGILDHLPPGERASLLDPVKESISQAKRLHILKGSADASRLDGVDVTATNITYDKSDDTVNDHIKIVKLTGGKVTVNADLSKVPFTDEYLKLVFPNGLPGNAKTSQTVDIADVAAKNGEPVRIAAQQVKGKWYPSLLYTIADAAARDSGQGNPGPGDYVAPKGASSPEDAVKQAVDAMSKGDYRRLIELASPDELAVVHDYGGLILKNTDASPQDFTVKDLQLNSTNISDGKRVTLKSITVDAGDHETKVTVNGDCLEVTVDGDFRKFCADQIVTLLNSGPLKDRPLTAEQSAALTRLAQGIPNIGIATSQSDGQWYLNPIRSYLDLSNALVEPLHDNDLIVLLKLVMDQ